MKVYNPLDEALQLLVLDQVDIKAISGDERKAACWLYKADKILLERQVIGPQTFLEGYSLTCYRMKTASTRYAVCPTETN